MTAKGFAVACVSACASIGSSASADCLKYEPATVTLTGTVEIKPFFGPPGFGKTPAKDEKMHQAILELDKPICTIAKAGDAYDGKAENNIRALQMLFTDYPFGTQWHGQHVVVTGTLFHSFSDAHYTRVLIAAGAVHAVEK